MNKPASHTENPADMSREEFMAILFSNMVIQQTNMAMMLLGKVPHPETNEFIRDFEAARMFIDQLEMLEVKTKGNLSKQEEALLKQALTALRMTFVESVDAPAPEIKAGPALPSATTPSSPAPAPEKAPTAAATPPKEPSPAPAETPTAPDESRKKFSKKY